MSWDDILKECKLVGSGIDKLNKRVDDLKQTNDKRDKEATEYHEKHMQRLEKLRVEIDEEVAAWYAHGIFVRAAVARIAVIALRLRLAAELPQQRS
ncbi:MAG: hypothetical protein SGARI_006272, partial [Bacillariaceae sp.]